MRVCVYPNPSTRYQYHAPWLVTSLETHTIVRTPNEIVLTNCRCMVDYGKRTSALFTGLDFMDAHIEGDIVGTPPPQPTYTTAWAIEYDRQAANFYYSRVGGHPVLAGRWCSLTKERIMMVVTEYVPSQTIYPPDHRSYLNGRHDTSLCPSSPVHSLPAADQVHLVPREQS